MDSRFSKLIAAVKNAASGSGIGGGQTTLDLPRNFLSTEYHIEVNVSQTFAGAPASCDIRKFIKSFELRTASGGALFSCNGAQLVDLARLSEPLGVPSVTLGTTSTARFIVPVHCEMDGALHDLLTAIRGNEESGITMAINWADNAANGFAGGTTPGATNYTVSVEEKSYPGMTAPKGMWGASLLGSAQHVFKSQNGRTGTASGAIDDFLLTTGGRTRYILLHATNTATGAFSDAIIDRVRIEIGNAVVRDVSAFNLQQSNQRHNLGGLAVPGLVVVDFGDDEKGWLDLQNVTECRVKVSVLAGAPAYRIELAQDFMK